MVRSVVDLFDRQARNRPLATALVASSVISGREERLTYAELADTSRHVAAGLTALGIRSKERVAIAASNQAGRELVIGMLALMRLGAVFVPLNPRLTAAEMTYAMNFASCGWLMAESPMKAAADAAEIQSLRGVIQMGGAPGPGVCAWRSLENTSRLIDDRQECSDETALASILFTSGTTARPKGVMMTHSAALATGRCFAGALNLSEQDVVITGVPFFTSSGSHMILMSIAAVGATYVMEPSVDAGASLDRIRAERGTIYIGVPAVMTYLLDAYDAATHDLSSLRLIDYGGAPIASEVVRRLSETFPSCDLRQNYGLTEPGPTGTVIRKADMLAHPGSVGRPMPDCAIRVLDSTGRDVPCGAVGEIAIYSPGRMSGYLDDPEATARTLRDGWILSGDLGRLDTDGFLYHVDRLKDVIIRGGMNISSVEIEERLMQHPAVIEAAAVGAPHAVLGEEVHAFAVVRQTPRVTEEGLLVFASKTLAHFKTPKTITFVDVLPRNAIGKVLKAELRDRAATQRLSRRS